MPMPNKQQSSKLVYVDIPPLKHNFSLCTYLSFKYVLINSDRPHVNL